MYLKKSENHEFGSYVNRRIREGDDDFLITIPHNDKSLGVNESINYVFSRMSDYDVEIVKTKLGLKYGKFPYKESEKSKNKYRYEMKRAGISRSDFYN